MLQTLNKSFLPTLKDTERKAGVCNCRIVAPERDGSYKTCHTPKKMKALFNWEIFRKHDQLSLSYISLETIFDTNSIQNTDEFHSMILSIDWSWSFSQIMQKRADKVVTPGDNIHSYYRTTVTKD